jgi:magnesium chelatase family protein
MNPCPCGWLGHDSGRCHCTPERIARYRARVSGPLLDRIDLGLEVPAIPADVVVAGMRGASGAAPGTAEARAQATSARERQMARQGKANARLTTREIDIHCRPDVEGGTMLVTALTRLSLSARACHRVLKVARTIADLAARESIEAAHIAEAVGFRRFDAVPAAPPGAVTAIGR